MGSFKNLINLKFGRLSVIRNAGLDKRGGYMWECSCDCGGKTIVRSDGLKSGHVKSCGCIKKVPDEEEYKEKIRNRLIENSTKIGDCLFWNGMISSSGYGIINYRGKSFSTHRASFMVFKGNIPNKMWVLHKCDNKCCVNPDHLWLGNAKDNMIDCMNKGRFKENKNTQFKPVKLNDKDIIKIRSSELTRKELALRFNVSKEYIRDILNMKVRKNVV